MPSRRPVFEKLAHARRLMDEGRTAEAVAHLRTAASDIAGEDPAAASTLLVAAVQPTLLLSGPEGALSVAAEAVHLSGAHGGAAELTALTRLGDAYAWAGRYSEAREAWKRATAIPALADPSVLCERANALLRAGELRAARDVSYEAVVRARQTESRADLLDGLAMACAAEVHLGNLPEALSCAEQQLAATDAEDGVDRVDAIASVAWVTALLGDVDRCERLLADAHQRIAELRFTALGGLAAGMLALGQGRFHEAVGAFEGKLAWVGMPPVAQALSLRPYVSSLVEAYARAGRTDDARNLVDQLMEAALACEQPRVAAPALRAHGVAYEDAASFDEAMTWHDRWGNRFEEARTLLARGELLRRRKQRAAARSDLDAAVQRFSQVGAATWHARAAAELRAAGDRSAPMPALATGGPEALSQRESTIVELIAQGLSNREIATRLFLSVKTVEAHLTTIYGKMGIGSRAQLIAAVAGRATPPADGN